MRRLLGFIALLALASGGCIFAPRSQQAQMKEAIVPGAKYQRVYDATEGVLEKYFEILYADPNSGVITTRYSQSKSPEEGIVKIRAIAVVTDDRDKPRIHLKVVKERFVERWDVWGHNIVENDEFLGADKIMEGRLLTEIEQGLVQPQAGALGAPPMPQPAAATPPTPATATATPPLTPAPGAPPSVVAFPPPPGPAPKK